MEHHTGTGGRAALRLVDGAGEPVWDRDPALDEPDAGVLDELAELFIGGGEPEDDERHAWREEREHAPIPREEAPMEAIITGHLPVRGAVWVRSYAARVAEEIGAPVALVRVSPEHTCVELIGSSAADADPVTSIPTAIEAAGCAARRWLLHFDELNQASLLKTEMLDAVTVLSGADEPAIVAAYRLIKSISEEGDPADSIGVSIVGADRSSAERAATRLVNATRQFLGFTLAVQPGVPKVRPAHGALLGEVDARHDPLKILALIAEQPAAEEEPPAAGERGRGPVIAGSNGEAVAAGDSVDLPTDRPALATLVAGLRPLDLPCPVAPCVELAQDDAGRLHLLSWWSPEAPAGLLRASAWARVNMPLLERVCPGLAAQPSAPAQHIVCEDLGVAADMRGTNTMIHLVQRAELAPAGGWMCGRVS